MSDVVESRGDGSRSSFLQFIPLEPVLTPDFYFIPCFQLVCASVTNALLSPRWHYLLLIFRCLGMCFIFGNIIFVGDPLIATFIPPLCSACREPELDNWRKKEGLIKFIMNCHVHRSSMRRPTAMQLRIRSEPYLGSLSSSNVCSPFQFDFARARDVSFRNDFQDRDDATT